MVIMKKIISLLKGLALKIRNGLFLASSRTYGERYVEPLIRRRCGLLKADNNSYDAKDRYNKKYEIKSCKVLEALGDIRNASLIDQIVFENRNLPTNRLIPFCDADKADYDANVQNVKRDHFDYLIYVLLFADCIKVFKVEKCKINSTYIPGWSDKHGRYDALGKSGQFNINKDRIKYHINNFLIDTISYEEATSIYRWLSK